MNRILLFCGLFSLFLFSSCVMNKIGYVKNMVPDSLYTIKVSDAITIQPADRLSITVSTISSKNKDLAAPFNIETGGYTLSTEKEAVQGVNAVSSLNPSGSLNTINSVDRGYLVDSKGYIDYPVFGKIKVSGLSLEEIRSLLSNMLIGNNYITDPLVKVNLLNFKIMVMGDIQNMVIDVPNGKINILEAIVRAGGLPLTSDPENIMVIREEGDKRILYQNNIEKYDIYNSESFQLRQNDIVYVPAKYRQISPSTQTAWQLTGMFISILSLGISAAALFIRRN